MNNIILFKNPANGHVTETNMAWLWVLLMGPFYFLFKGIWTHALGGLALNLLFPGLAWLIYPFFANQIVRNWYHKRGWIELG